MPWILSRTDRLRERGAADTWLAQESGQDLGEAFRFLNKWRVAAALEDHQPGAADPRMQRPADADRRLRVVPPDDEQGRASQVARAGHQARLADGEPPPVPRRWRAVPVTGLDHDRGHEGLVDEVGPVLQQSSFLCVARLPRPRASRLPQMSMRHRSGCQGGQQKGMAR